MNFMWEASAHTICDPQFHSEQTATDGITQPREQEFM